MMAHRLAQQSQRNHHVLLRLASAHLQHRASSAAAAATTTVGSALDLTKRHAIVPPKRLFHATRRQEILPLIGAATVFVIGRYSWKALKRMDAEWEDYQWELQQYEKQQMAQSSGESLTVKTVAIDLGTIYTKLAVSHPKPEVVTSREGDRAFFNGILYEGEGNEAVIRGRSALERFYYPSDGESPPCPVTLPWNELETDRAHAVVGDSLGPALNETLERLGFNPDDANATPFRSIVTLPTKYLHSEAYKHVFFEDFAPTLLPEPVAAIWGAQARSLLPSEDDKLGRTTVVLDVGGQATQLSVVQKDIVLATMSLPWGGERWIQLLVDLLQKESHIPLQDARSLSAIQTQARAALTELSSKTRVDVHVPYLFPDPGNHHLDTSMSRNVFEQAIQEDVRDRLVDVAKTEDALSPHMPTPTDLSSFLVSALTQVLELSQKTPMNVDSVLLVGGAARAPLVSASLEAALYTLMGADATKKLALPESSDLPDLTALGAATMLPTYGYSVESGLERH